jgi:CBS domain-containing protein
LTTVQHVLKEKDQSLWYISPEATVLEAIDLMAVNNVGALVVIENDKPVGIFSERDLARKLSLSKHPPGELIVKRVMTPFIITVTPEQSIDECMMLMTNHRIRHLPVIANDRIIGMVSIGDIVKTVLSESERIMAQLRKA